MVLIKLFFCQKVKYFFNQTEYELIYECDEGIIGSDTLLIYSIDKKITELYKNLDLV